MKTSLRSIAFALASLSLVATPLVHAERLGTNPRPDAVVVDAGSMAAVLAYTVFVAFGI